MENMAWVEALIYSTMRTDRTNDCVVITIDNLCEYRLEEVGNIMPREELNTNTDLKSLSSQHTQFIARL
jgi:hypothetical protein